MTLLTAAVVTLVVWAVSLVRSVPARALIYSLPVPITLVLVTTGIPVGAEHLLGVVLLNAFVAVVAWLHSRGLHILLADLGGVVAYVGGSWALLRLGHLPFRSTLVLTLIAWTLVVAMDRRRPRGAGRSPASTGMPTLVKLVVIAAGALLTVSFGQLLQGLVVTFPYAGVLVVVETRRDLPEFRAHFTRASIGLLAFFTAYALVQDVSRIGALVAAWAVFAGCWLLLRLARTRRPTCVATGPVGRYGRRMAESDIPAAVRAGYAFTGPALELGALVVGDACDPTAKVRIPLSMVNRHGLVAGATGTGKTKTLQTMAEQLSAAGVPVFLADIKGDLSGMAAPGEASDRVTTRAKDIGYDWQPAAFPVEFFALGGRGTGVPVRATITAFGPTLLSKVLGLNDVQESSLGLVFHFADKNALPLLDLADLRAVIQYLTSPAGAAELAELGGLSKATAGVILRKLIAFADAGAEDFFGETEFDTRDFLRVAPDGRGVVSVLELPSLQDRPELFATFLMWFLADLFHDLPEVGDVDKPKLVFFFDEAHLLFNDASKEFLAAVTQTVRLIRSKGVGVFFVTQTPKDVPGDVLAQLGNRVQHALRAYTPDDAKALKATASTFPKSGYDLEEVLTQLGTGEAIVTVLSERGAPAPVAWTRVPPPRSLMAQVDPAVAQGTVAASELAARYGARIDRESAYEMLLAKVAVPPPAAPAPAPAPGHAPSKSQPEDKSFLERALGSAAVRGALRSAATAAGREIARSIFGTARRRR